MYLKKLELYGFKSFAERVVIDFKKGITGIVGPNGSGKSNIIDAVRWVLGEQSAKTLRGSRMEDIIFSGTSHRKPLGMAEVSLTFDNSKKILPIDYSEVTITRRMYRSGESEYLINKTPCRLKDIKELLMDTGIGIDGYSLIGQGRIDRILSNKPDERRQVFEEAAGIVKYKTRKEEAEKKLENTYNNIVRIEDIISELSTRIDPLESESIKAKKYLQLSEELKQLELNLFLNEIDEIKTKQESESKQYNVVEEQLNNYMKEKEILTNRQYEVQKKIENLEKDIQNLKENYYETDNLIKKLEGDKILFKEKISNIDNNYSRITKEIEEIDNNRRSISEQLRTLLDERDKIDNHVLSNCKSLDENNEKYNVLSSYLSKDEEKIECSKSEIIEILNSISNIKSEISSLKTLKDNFIKRINKINEEKLEITEKENNTMEEKYNLENEINLLKEQFKKENIAFKKMLNESTELNNKHETLKKYYEKKQNHLRDIEAERKLLQAMEDSYEGFNSSVRKTLQICKTHKELGRGIHGVVAELMSLPKEYEIAIDVALGYSMQYIVCDNEESAKRIIKYLKENNLGRVTFLPLSNISIKKERNSILSKLHNYKGFIGMANELIMCSQKYKDLFTFLLGNTIIVDNIDTATKISNLTKFNKNKIVTLDGDIINPSGTITGGTYKSKISNVFSRKRKINELSQKYESVYKNLMDCKRELEIYESKIDKIKEKIENSSNYLEELKISLFKKENKLEHIINELAAFNATKEKLSIEFIQLDDNLNDINNSVKEKEEKIKSLQLKNLQLQNQIDEESKLISENYKELEQLKEEITSIKVTLASLKEKKENIANEINRIESLIKSYEENMELKEKELKKLLVEKQNFNESLNNINIKINDNNVLIKQVEYNISKYEQEKNKWNSENREINNKINIYNNTIDELKESLHKIEVRKTRLEMQHDTLIKKIWEKYELSYIDALKQKTEIKDFNYVSKRISILKKEIKDLGEVNLNSIKEFKEVYERYNFLNSQKDDLIKAKNSLKKVISELETTMKKQFTHSFNDINKNFNVIFNQLFNGGKACLILEDELNVLNSNIEIVAQPPGKKLQNLNLLSGGEKALTAIALLFAILKTKPTPFCILDEIEAALDDVNIFRFADFLKEFSKSSQFIIITHRKGTMEIIDYLYGVTMEEYGVSKIVSVKLSEIAS